MATWFEAPVSGSLALVLLLGATAAAEPAAGKADRGKAAADKGKGEKAPPDGAAKAAPAAADKGAAAKGTAEAGGKAQAGAPATDKKAGVPLAPTQEELDRLRAQQKQEPEMGAGYGTKKLLRRPFPTSTGNTAGPSATQGAGTSQDRKAATLDAGGPTQGVRR